MNIYAFTQNNSGGRYIGPHVIIVYANTEDQAIEIAEKHGLDYDAPYCRCCGGRWGCPDEIENVDSFLDNYSFMFSNKKPSKGKEEWIEAGELVIVGEKPSLYLVK